MISEWTQVIQNEKQTSYKRQAIKFNHLAAFVSLHREAGLPQWNCSLIYLLKVAAQVNDIEKME